MENNLFHEKPLCLRKHEASIFIETAINSACEQNSLSFSELEDILYKCYSEARRGADFERMKAEKLYKEMSEKNSKKGIEQNGT